MVPNSVSLADNIRLWDFSSYQTGTATSQHCGNDWVEDGTLLLFILMSKVLSLPGSRNLAMRCMQVLRVSLVLSHGRSLDKGKGTWDLGMRKVFQEITFARLHIREHCPVRIFSHELNDVFRLFTVALFMIEVGIFNNKGLVKLTVGHLAKRLSCSYRRDWRSSLMMWRVLKL